VPYVLPKTDFLYFRAVQSCNLISTSQRTTVVTPPQINIGGIAGGGGAVKVKSEDPTFVFTPVSPRSASGSSAPDFFVASTRSTADVKSSYSSYCRLISDDTKSVVGGGSLFQSADYHQMKSDPGNTVHTSTTTTFGASSSSSHVKIIASLSPKRDGGSSTRIISSSSIRDSLPKELIDKIKAASQGRKTIAIIEPITRHSSSSGASRGLEGSHAADAPFGGRLSGLSSRFSVAAANLNRWRSVGVVPPLSNSNNNISDHDYCCPRPGGRYR
jgi:hypothetical protein